MTLQDDLGNDVTVSVPCKRIVSLAPNITEILYLIKADSLLVGVTDYCNYPEDAFKKNRIGGMINPDYELISSLSPELVLMTVEGNSKSSYQALKNLGINVYVFNPRNIDGILNMIKNIGTITGRTLQSVSVISDLKNKKVNLLKSIDTVSYKSCLVTISVNPLISINKNSFLNEIIHLCGLKNIYEEEIADYPLINHEDVIKKNPEYIIFPADISDSLNNKKYLSELNNKLYLTDAVKNGNIILTEADIFLRPGPRIFDAVKNIRNSIFGI